MKFSSAPRLFHILINFRQGSYVSETKTLISSFLFHLNLLSVRIEPATRNPLDKKGCLLPWIGGLFSCSAYCELIWGNDLT